LSFLTTGVSKTRYNDTPEVIDNYSKYCPLIPRVDDAIVVVRKEFTMVDGLRVTLTGGEPRQLLAVRAANCRTAIGFLRNQNHANSVRTELAEELCRPHRIASGVL